MKQELLKDIAGTISFTPYLNNRPVVASSATVTLKKPGGATLQSSTSATVNGTTGEITYSLSTSLTATLDENYVADWIYVVSGVNYYRSQLFDVVRHRLVITVTDQDLVNEQSDVLDMNEGVSGMVDSSTGTTLVDTELKQYDDDYFNGGKVKITNTATGEEQTRTVSDFVSSTCTITIASAWSTNPDTTYSYVVRKGFVQKITNAFNEVIAEVRSHGFRPALILESSELHVPVVKKSLSIICKDNIKEPNDKWHELYKIYTEEYIAAMSKLKFQYDADESGDVSGDDEQDRETSLRMRR